MPAKTPITVAYGDGIGPEIMSAVLQIVEAAGAAEASCTDSFRCRFLAEGPTDMGRLIALLKRISEGGMEITMAQTLRAFDAGQ